MYNSIVLVLGCPTLKNLVVTLTQNLLKSDVAQKVVQGKLILADS
jgi:hypothetical protein